MRLQQHIFLYVLLFVFVLPVSGGGCEPTDGSMQVTVCVSWTQAASSCPARADARQLFSGCSFTLVSVDSDGTAGDSDGDGQDDYCCYEVTALDVDEEGPECS